MAFILKPPQPLDLAPDRPGLFLAGSIEMGRAVHWQALFEQELSDLDVTILNPRRDDWDASWEQSLRNPNFRGQVEWELDAQEKADAIAMYFAPETHAPITLLELGLFASSQKLIVCCPEGFWRKGNVEVVCLRYGVPTVETLPELVAATRRRMLALL